jgi:site-specific DNA recombinase
VVETAFDDGGFSGGNLERPALQRLLQQIEARQVDCVVVYKVDRLSRSLLDFARLMGRFEECTVSFVSVTQQFNSTTSLGRLTLNILLSFAQFERELISERTRDKMSAARRKGKWVGGTPVLGYDVAAGGGRLIVNSGEARQVREIFELYRQHRSLAVVAAELGQRGWTSKKWQSRQGLRHGGRPFTKILLRGLLTNAVYAGQVRYRGEMYPGEHPAIIEGAAWEDVNRDFDEADQEATSVPHQPRPALLAGLVICNDCHQPMIATYSAKGARRYRYYVCQRARQKGWKACPTKSVSASLLEDSIALQLRARLSLAAPPRESVAVGNPDWIRSQVEQIRYDGPGGIVSVRLRAADAGAGERETAFEYALPRRRGRALPSFRLRPASEEVQFFDVRRYCQGDLCR